MIGKRIAYVKVIVSLSIIFLKDQLSNVNTK